MEMKWRKDGSEKGEDRKWGQSGKERVNEGGNKDKKIGGVNKGERGIKQKLADILFD